MVTSWSDEFPYISHDSSLFSSCKDVIIRGPDGFFSKHGETGLENLLICTCGHLWERGGKRPKAKQRGATSMSSTKVQ